MLHIIQKGRQHFFCVFLKRTSHFIDLFTPFLSPLIGVRIGEKVSQAEILGVSRTRRPGQTAQDDRRSGENLVPKSSHQMEVSDDNDSIASFYFHVLVFVQHILLEFSNFVEEGNRTLFKRATEQKKEQLHYQ